MSTLENHLKASGATQSAKIIRRLGGLERWQSALQTLDLYRNTLVTCQYAIPLELRDPSAQTELVGTIETAIITVVRKHSILWLGLLGIDTKKPAWIQLDGIRRSQHIQWQFPETMENSESFMTGVFEAELDTRFRDLESQPGWRVVIIHSRSAECAEVMFIFHHAWMDGMSGKIFHEDLLHQLNTGRNEKDLRHFDDYIPSPPESSTTVPPPTEVWSRLSFSAPFVVKTVWNELGPSVFRDGSTLAKWAPIQTSPFKTGIQSFSIDGHILDRVLIACRKHNTTVTGLLHGLALVSFSCHLEETGAAAFESSTSLDLRRILPEHHPSYPRLIPKRTISNHVSIATHKFDTAHVAQIRSKKAQRTPDGRLSGDLTDLVWRSAAQVRRELSQRLSSGAKNEPIGLLKLVGDWRAELRNKTKHPRQSSWEVTNLGVLEGQSPAEGSHSDQHHSWSIHRAEFAVSALVPGSAMVICAISVAGKQLRVSCSWQDCVLDVKLATGIVVDLERWLIQIGA